MPDGKWFKFRRGGGNARSRDINDDREGDGGNGPSAKKPNKSQESADGESNQGKERKHGTTAEIVIAFVTIMLFVVAWRQNGIQSRQADISQNQLALGKRQFDFTANEAAASSNAQSASLNVSESAARATADQAAAMNEMAAASNEQAVAARQQAQAAESQARSAAELVKAQEARQVVITVEIKGIEKGGLLEAEFKITNAGTSTITNAEFDKGIIVVRLGLDHVIWQALKMDYSQTIGPGQTISVVATREPLTKAEAYQLQVAELEIVAAARIRFFNPDQHKPEERRACMVIEQGDITFERHPCRE